MIKVDGHSHLYRDEKTGAIINRNNTEYQNRLRKIKSTETQKEDLNKMREDIDELKGLLRQLLEKKE
jgi:hypothetical protein